LRGDSGTGKEVAARAAHELSGRSGPFVAVNCGGLPVTLIASELFGVKRGAYSGAHQDREGLVRAAHGGTLFLDEIAELGPEPQAALLRVLQEHEVVPVGGTKAVKVDLRVVAATNQPLDHLAASGRFRRDLLARLRGFELRLPPLRERMEDLGYLVAQLLSRIEPGRPRAFHRAAARALFRHRWPLHIRELEQALRAATAVARETELALEDLPATVRAEVTGPKPDASAEPPTRERLVALVAEHAGNVSHVANALHTSRTQVRRLAARWAIDLEGARRK
jgi:DNA-binding NtrC family response regulator